VNKYRVVFTDINKDMFMSSILQADNFKMVHEDTINRLVENSYLCFADGRVVNTNYVVSFKVVIVEEGEPVAED
jgi:hypothetical protein